MHEWMDLSVHIAAMPLRSVLEQPQPSWFSWFAGARGHDQGRRLQGPPNQEPTLKESSKSRVLPLDRSFSTPLDQQISGECRSNQWWMEFQSRIHHHMCALAFPSHL
mmetsp:Transcript_7860/g.15618  ORF Transcript_7860/g.15618 Transcript_7860/m.15618 type:complete len:107 (-) Transcript_7860:304-624(-)